MRDLGLGFIGQSIGLDFRLKSSLWFGLRPLLLECGLARKLGGYGFNERVVCDVGYRVHRFAARVLVSKHES